MCLSVFLYKYFEWGFFFYKNTCLFFSGFQPLSVYVLLISILIGPFRDVNSFYNMFQVLKPPLDNGCSLLRMLVTADSKPTRLSEQSIVVLSSYVAEYLMDVVQVSILTERLTSHKSTTCWSYVIILPILYFQCYLGYSIILFHIGQKSKSLIFQIQTIIVESQHFLLSCLLFFCCFI